MGYQDLIGRLSQAHAETNCDSDISEQHPAIREFLELTYDIPLQRAPNTEMSQGHYTMELLGEVIRRVSGKTLPEFARERIFEPLGMKDTFFVRCPRPNKERAVRHPSPHPALQFFMNLRVPWASLSVFTSPRDMLLLGPNFPKWWPIRG